MNAYRYTCTGCNKQVEPYELGEWGHVCDGWWDDHGLFDALPAIEVERVDGQGTSG